MAFLRSVSPLAFALLLFTGCHLDGVGPNPPHATGLAYAESDHSAHETADALLAALESNEAIGVVADVDHAANADRAGLDLRPTRVLLFGNPNLGTPLMQRNQTAGIDLPQKILVLENGEGEVYAAYNTTDYLASRHGLAGVETLPMIANALKMLTENVTGGMVKQPVKKEVHEGEGLVIVESDFSVDETFGRLESAIESNPNLTVLAQLDHQANAARVGLDLRPTRLLVFGNPNLGTLLMQRQQSIGIDLPQKVLIWEDADGTVHLAYNNPFFLAERHGLDGPEDVLTTISNALAMLAQGATTD